MIDEFSINDEREAMNIEQFLSDESWIAATIKNWDFVEEPLNDMGVRLNDQDGAFYEA
jgi:hypothetical protein